MNADQGSNQCRRSPAWGDLVDAHVRGERAATESLVEHLTPELRRVSVSFLGKDDPEVDDVVGEALVAILAYLTRRGGFTGNLAGFAVTVAANRCRNLIIWRKRRPRVPLEALESWIADEEASALDLLLARERSELLQATLRRIGRACAHLLRAFYVEGRTIESLREELGLASVQAVYYRRGVCLEKALEVLNQALGRCSREGGDDAGRRPPTGGGSGDR